MTLELLNKARQFNTLFMEYHLAVLLGQSYDPSLLVELGALKLEIDAELRSQKAKAEGA